MGHPLLWSGESLRPKPHSSNCRVLTHPLGGAYPALAIHNVLYAQKEITPWLR